MESNLRDANYFVEKLGLKEHPEGGYYTRENQSKESVDSNPNKLKWTSIHFLLRGNQVSHFHRIKNSDELWFEFFSFPKLYSLKTNSKKIFTFLFF